MLHKKQFVCISAFSLSLALLLSPILGFGAEKYVTYLNLTDYTGPIAGFGVYESMGLSDVFKDINNRGGIEGVKVKFIGVDTRYDLAHAVSAFNRYRMEHKLLLIEAPSTALAKVVGPILSRDRLSVLTPGDGESEARPGRIFLFGVTYQNGFAAAIDWMIEDWQKKGNPRKPIVGYIGWDNPYGKEALLGGKEYADKIGVKLLPPEFFPPGSLKLDVWLNRLAQGGANYIYVSGTDPAPTKVIQDAYALGLTKKIQMVTDFYGPCMGVGVKAHPKELEGTVITSFYLRGVEAFEHTSSRYWKKYREKPLSEMTDSYILGLINGLTFETALKVGLKEVGYDKLDSEAMYKVFQKLTDMDVNEGLTSLCAYSSTSRQRSKQIKFYRVTNARVVPFTGWRIAPDAVSLHKW